MKHLKRLLASVPSAFAIRSPQRRGAPAQLGRGIPTLGGSSWRPEHVLLPVNPIFIWVSLLVTLLWIGVAWVLQNALWHKGKHVYTGVGI